jgi:DNA-binding NtrC family response regulator
MKAHNATVAENKPYEHILVVDDEGALRKLHSAILTRAGYRVETARDGVEALAQLAAGTFDLVFTDRQMPNLDGEGLVLEMRSTGCRIPVVMISGSLRYSPLPPRVAGEVSAALPKPIRATEVIAAVFNALHPDSRGLAAAA